MIQRCRQLSPLGWVALSLIVLSFVRVPSLRRGLMIAAWTRFRKEK